MLVCDKCLRGIESHEGNQMHRHLGIDEENQICEWCEDSEAEYEI